MTADTRIGLVVTIATVVVTAALLGFGYEMGKRSLTGRPLKLSNGGYQTDNGPIIRVPGVPDDYQIEAIYFPPAELWQPVYDPADHTWLKNPRGITLCIAFEPPKEPTR